MPNVFAVPVFFVVFRETIEAAIIVSVLLAFIKQTLGGPGGSGEDRVVYRRLLRQIWAGTFLGLLICFIIGGGMIGAFYGLGKDVWGNSEDLWEGIFSLIASIIITIMGAAILRLSKLQTKWQTKLTSALSATTTKKNPSALSKKYALFLLPFITVLREGLEAVVFVGGVSIAAPASAFPLPVVTGLFAGAVVGWLVYRGKDTVRLQVFLIASTAVLYLVAAGLFSKAIWSFEMWKFARLVGGDVAETGAGPGSYDIRKSVWHVNCCSPQLNGGSGWGIFNAILGWQNSATYGSVISYNVYWIVVSAGLLVMMFRERNGRWPGMSKPKSKTAAGDEAGGIRTATDVESAEVGNSIVTTTDSKTTAAMGKETGGARVEARGIEG